MARRLSVGLLLLLAIAPAHAARAPIRSYGAAEGLLDAGVRRVRMGPDGFVWIATRGGLWRFDGERFDVLGPEEGVPRGEVLDFAFAPSGELWLAGERGLFHGDPASVPETGKVFTEIPLGDPGERELAYRIALARDGTAWVGTLHGLWRIDDGAPRRVPLPAKDTPSAVGRVQSLAVAPSGDVWVGSHVWGVFRVRPSGAVDHAGDWVPGCHFVRDFLFDDRGGVWTAFLGGIARLDAATFGEEAKADVVFRPAEGLPGVDTQTFLSLGPDRFLLSTIGGITEIDRDGDGRWHVGATLDRRSGLPDDDAQSVARDDEGNLWIGFDRGGLAKRIASGILEQDDAEEPGTRIVALGHDREGRLAVFSRSRPFTLRVVTEGGTRTRRLAVPKNVFYGGWGVQQLLAQERDGTWWFASGFGALRYDPSSDGLGRLERPPEAIGFDQGLPSSDIYLLYGCGNGDVWTSSGRMRPGISTVARIRHGDRAVETFRASEIESPLLAVGFAEDAAAGLWIAFEDGTVVRRRNGVFERVGRPFEGLDAAPFVLDARGRLFILGEGLAVVDRPTDEHPAVRRCSLPSTLADAVFTTGVDDGTGVLYLGAARGVARFEPEQGRARWLTSADGLAPGLIRLVARDRDGVLWFSDETRLSRLTPGIDPPAEPHVPRVRSVRIAGVPVALPPMGSRSVGPLTIDPSRRTVGIEYFAVHHGPGEPPRFEHRLGGAEDAWTDDGSGRAVLYAGLAPGRYRFAVRTGPSSGEATVDLVVLAPVWRRGWFLGLVAIVVAAAAYGAHRVRVASVLAVERVRTRIATDLHDEIGSSLSQISVLSQVAAREGAAGGASRSLSRIGELARSVTQSVGETVWAISPREDRLSELVGRMRRFGLDLFADGATGLVLDLPPGEPDEHLDPEIRRTIYLVFKEALHNARKHAGARAVHASLRRTRSGFELLVRDDGRGFDATAPSRGHGLEGMRRRAGAASGSLEIRTPSGGGTEVVLRVPAKATSLFGRIVGRPPRET